MYQTARMLANTLSRTACAVCITRFAIRPAKSSWKNDQPCRITCQWLCQRTSVVAPGISTLCRIATSTNSTSGRSTSTAASMPASTGASRASAAARSVASIIDTRRPTKSGISVSTSATARLVANTAAYQPGVCRRKCA